MSFSGKMYFCPIIRVEVGDLTKSSLEELWNGERYVELRRRLLEHTLFPVCGRCCKVELSAAPAPEVAAMRAAGTLPNATAHETVAEERC